MFKNKTNKAIRTKQYKINPRALAIMYPKRIG
jgi:hypothetical protein